MGKFTEFKLPLKGMSPGIHEVDYHLDKQFFVNMESQDVHDADLNVKLIVDHKGDFYNLDFHIVGEVTLLCDRCLDDLQFPIDATYKIAVQFGDDYNDENDDLLVIPSTDNTLNVAYMIYDTVVLQIPIKHVHPLGKCNRAMSAILKKHRVRSADDEDAELEEQLIEEMDQVDAGNDDAPTDPRWDELKKLTDNN